MEGLAITPDGRTLVGAMQSPLLQVGNIVGSANLAAKAVPKLLFLDVVGMLVAAGIPAFDIPAKLGGLAFGPDVVIAGQAKHTLWMSNDNDFTPVVPNSHHASGFAENPNTFFVFAFDEVDLPGFVPQQFRRPHRGERDDDRRWNNDPDDRK